MTDATVIDRAVLDRMLDSFGGDRAFLSEMLDTYFEDAPRQLDSMRNGLASDDSELVRRAAHSLKSNSANFGALELAARCRELEMLAKAGSLQRGYELLDQIVTGYDRAQAALEQVRAGD